MHDNDPVRAAENILACREVVRDEGILAELDPDQLGPEPPAGVPALEWAEFTALCDRLDAQEAPTNASKEADRSAGST